MGKDEDSGTLPTKMLEEIARNGLESSNQTNISQNVRNLGTLAQERGIAPSQAREIFHERKEAIENEKLKVAMKPTAKVYRDLENKFVTINNDDIKNICKAPVVDESKDQFKNLQVAKPYEITDSIEVENISEIFSRNFISLLVPWSH